MSLFEELRRRNVHRVALGYLAGAWLLIQIVETLFPVFGLPDAGIRAVVIILAIGFLPALFLSWKFEWTSAGLRREQDISRTETRAPTKTLDRAITATLVLAVAYFAIDKFVLDPARDAAEIEAATERAIAEAQIDSLGEKSLLVLPFENMSPDPDQAYFADGISEELLNLLAGVDALRVISRSTAWTFKGEKVDIPAVQARLNLSHILEGSVRKAGDRVRITAQLIDARTDSHLWSETYDRTLDDIFAIQDEISAHIVSELKLKLVNGTPSSVVIDPRAYELYLQARYVTGGYLEDRYEEAEWQLRKVLEIEPDFVPAIWELTRLVSRKEELAETEEELAQVQAEVDALIAHMVEIAPTSSYANGWLAHRAWSRENDYQKAAHYYELAVAGGTDSNRYFQLGQAARFMARLGRPEEAAEIFGFILSRDPASAPLIYQYARVLRLAGRYREAAEQLETILTWHVPSFTICWNLGVSWLLAGDADRALEYFNKLEQPPGHNLGRLLALYSQGRQAEFEEEFTLFRELNSDDHEAIARVYAWTGQNDLAFEWLDAMMAEGPSRNVLDINSGLYDPIKSDPRWQVYLEKNGGLERDLAAIEFHPELPDPDWEPVEPRPDSGMD